MDFDVNLRIKETTTGIGTDVNMQVNVERAESGFYIASNSIVSPMIGSGASPRYAILEFLSNFFYSKTTEAEEAK